jgi:hypothetical protein
MYGISANQPTTTNNHSDVTNLQNKLLLSSTRDSATKESFQFQVHVDRSIEEAPRITFLPQFSTRKRLLLLLQLTPENETYHCSPNRESTISTPINSSRRISHKNINLINSNISKNHILSLVSSTSSPSTPSTPSAHITSLLSPDRNGQRSINSPEECRCPTQAVTRAPVVWSVKVKSSPRVIRERERYRKGRRRNVPDAEIDAELERGSPSPPTYLPTYLQRVV